MKLIRLQIENNAIDIGYHPNENQAATAHYLITYDVTQPLNKNLENIKIRLAGLQFEVIILDNGLTYSFSDTIVAMNDVRFDIGLALTDLLNIPVVSQATVTKLGLIAAVKAKSAYLKWQPRSHGQEAMLTIGNGYFGLRGAFLESRADQDNYPGMYVAGVFDSEITTIQDHQVTNEDLVNLPNANL